MNDQRSALMVDIRNVEFRKEYHYFITFQLDGDEGKVCSQFLVLISSREEQTSHHKFPTPFSSKTPISYP